MPPTPPPRWSANTVERNCEPRWAAKISAYMLEEKPGAYIFLGNGDSAGLHHPESFSTMGNSPGRRLLDAAGGKQTSSKSVSLKLSKMSP